MKKNSFLGSILLLFLSAINLNAKDRTPLETFIAHVKDANTFVTVGNIWQPDMQYDQKEMLKSVTKGQPLTINYMELSSFMKSKTTAINLVLPATGGGTHTLELGRYDFFTSNFEVHDHGAIDKVYDYTPGLYYSGVVSGIPGSFAVFSFFNNEVWGVFSIPGEGNYVVAPNTLEGKEYDYNPHYILYNEDDLKIKDRAPKCGTDELKPIMHNAVVKTTTTANNNIYNNCTEVRCYEVADFATYQSKGNSVTNVTNYLTSLFNVKAALYRNEGVPIVLKYLQVNSVTDQYQALPTNSSSRWLSKFGWVTQTTMHGCDIATLFTTKGGGMGGVAWLGLMCQGYYAPDSAGPYAFCNIDNASTVSSFPTYTWDVEVSTHEMGHGVGSPHTHRCCWNPPARNTAIDGCYTIEGSCSNPGIPSATVKGTIMSYCHLTASGISFTNGFGQQPGDTIRYFLRNTFNPSTCGEVYTPNIALTSASRTLNANRECTDINGGVSTTYYWYDNNTASQTDDTLVLMVRKNGNNIGDLNTSGFAVTSGTLASWGGGTGQSITFPTGVSGLMPHNIAMRRFWKVAAHAQPTSNVEVIFPFKQTDIDDVDGSVPGTTLLKDFRAYRVSSPVDPTPGGGFSGATAASFTMYTYSTTASTNRWTFDTSAGVYYAHMLMNNLNGGALFYSYNTSAVSYINELAGDNGVYIYPNPATSEWNIVMTDVNTGDITMELYGSDGRMVRRQQLNSGANTVSAATLPAGLYMYRIICNNNIYKGNLLKQ
jgi:hypothetical protein